MSAPDYNPNSPDAMFARVLQRLDTQDATLARIESNTMSGLERIKSRVGSLERERWYQRGFAAAISAAVIAAFEWAKAKWGAS